jgi:FtsH-binding integral membrane protein
MENDQNQFKGKGALDAFLNLLSLITVGWLSIAVGMILFQLINKFFNNQAIDYVSSFSQEPLKFGIASAVILLPIYLAVAGWLHHHYKTGKLNHASGIHRWLTYLMLLVSALTIIGRLIYQLFRFLDGDYATAVILRTLVILVIAGGIFGYYLYDLIRKDFSGRSIVSMVAIVVVIVAVLASVVGGFIIIDSPEKSRAIKFDTKRVDDLSTLNSMINYFYHDKKSLPSDLSDAQFNNIKNDPETSKPYEYRVLTSDQYELCATFALATPVIPANYTSPMGDNFYYHTAGRQCYTKSAADPNAMKY